MRKPFYVKCEHQRRRSAYASAQYDQHRCFCCLGSIIPLVSICEIPSLQLISVAEQVSLSLTWSQTPEDSFSRDEAQMFSPVLSPFNALILQ